MTNSATEQELRAMRRFNRMYTRRIGVLDEGHLRTPFSLAEARVMYELAQGDDLTATDIGKRLGLDPGYLSRMLRGFRKRGLVARSASASDARRSHLRLTPRGRKTAATLNERADADIRALLAEHAEPERRRMLAAMQTIERTLDAARSPNAPSEPYLIRQHRPGDMGWVVHRHGVLYAEEYGWDERFEALVARIVADFIDQLDLARDRCWIAERDGDILGSIFLVKKSKSVAKLRLLLVEPSARGLGIGRRLVAECIRVARQAGYSKITLWTNSVLHAARHLYQEAGFHLVKEEAHHSFGHDLVGQTWELALRRDAARTPARARS